MIVPPCFVLFSLNDHLVTVCRRSPLSRMGPRCCQILIPVLAARRRPGLHHVTCGLVLGPQAFHCRLARLICVQAQDNVPELRILPQVCIQRPLMESAQGHRVAGDLPVQGTIAHEVNGGFKDKNRIQLRTAGEAEGRILVAASYVAFEAGAAPVIGAALAGEHRSSRPVPPHKHAVVVFGVLVQQSCLDKSPDHLGRDAPFLKIGKHAPLIRIGEWQGKGRRGLILLSVLAFGRHRLLRGGGIPRPAMVVKQIFHRLREALAAEPLEEGDGVSADAL